MKKIYISPEIIAEELLDESDFLSTSGSVSEDNGLDPASPTDPKEGEPMSVKTEFGGAWDSFSEW